MITQHSHSTLLNLYYQDKFIRINLFFSLLANIGLWLFLIWQAKSFTELISLHYNIYFGIDLLGYWHQIFLLPILGLVFFLINFLFGLAVYAQEKILSYFLACVSSFIQGIFILAAIFIVLINL